MRQIGLLYGISNLGRHGDWRLILISISLQEILIHFHGIVLLK